MKLIFGSIVAVCIATALLMPTGCSLESDGDDTVHLSDEIANPVNVLLSGDLGSVQLTLAYNRQPGVSVETLHALVADETITLTVENLKSGVSYGLQSGTLVDRTPASSGEFQVATSLDGRDVMVVFFNRFEGSSLALSGEYRAAVNVRSNVYFRTEQFVRDVEILGEE